MTAKTFDDFDLRYGKSVLAKLGLVPPDDHLGLLYEARLLEYDTPSNMYRMIDDDNKTLHNVWWLKSQAISPKVEFSP